MSISKQQEVTFRNTVFRINGDQIHIGKVVYQDLLEMEYQYTPIPQSTASVKIITQAHGSNLLDCNHPIMKRLQQDRFDTNELISSIKSLNNLQSDKGLAPTSIKGLKKGTFMSVVPGILLLCTPCVYQCYVSAEVKAYKKRRERLVQEAREFVDKNNAMWNVKYRYKLKIPDSFPEYLEVQLSNDYDIDKYAVKNLAVDFNVANHNNEMILDGAQMKSEELSDIVATDRKTKTSP